MFTLITGGSGSGKSEFAERYICGLCDNPVYIATMRPFGEEGRRRVEKHRQQRAGMGFSTIERYTDIGGINISGDGALLECVSNLAANEIFEVSAEGAEERTADGIIRLFNKFKNIVVVTNNVFSDGIKYPPETEEYIRILAEVNRRLAEYADQVAEIVCGIPVWIK